MGNYDYTYIGRKKCGCVVAATVDDPTRPKEVAKDVAGFIKGGLTVERVCTKEAPVMFHICKCDEKPATDQMDIEEPFLLTTGNRGHGENDRSKPISPMFEMVSK